MIYPFYKTIVILISDYNLENLRNLKNYISKWQIREENNPKVILTDVLEIYILELRKFDPNLNNSKQLSSWVKFLIKPSEAVDMANKNVNIDLILKCTDLTKKEIENLKKEN